jgi:mannitol-1-/sugar-/sorbitol-6-/2-deoxyglucose-6-phosphatase
LQTESYALRFVEVERLMIQAVIFDMDGVLLDSEPFWQDAEMEVFQTVGISLSRAQCIELTGLPTRELVAHCYKQKPWNHKSPEQVAEEIIRGVEERVAQCAIPLTGVREMLGFFRSHQLPLAVASSSPVTLIRSVLNKFSLTDVFSVIHSAEFEEYGKPHPAVFLTTAKQLHVDPIQCLVIEDSFNGLLAAKAARMKTIVIPMEAQRNESRFTIADLKLESLSEFSIMHWNMLQTIS